MKNNKKGFTLVELLAVIVVLAIVMGIAAVGITNVLDSTRKNAFVASARSYISGAKTIVNAGQVDAIFGTDSDYVPVCSDVASKNTKTIPLTAIKTENEKEKSPYGGDFDTTNSHVVVKATQKGTECYYSYEIYLTDGDFAIGTATVGILEANLNASEVKPVTGS